MSLPGKKHQFDLAGLNVPCSMCELLALQTFALTQGSSVAPHIDMHIFHTVAMYATTLWELYSCRLVFSASV